MPVKLDSIRTNNGTIGTYSIVSPYTGETVEFEAALNETQVVQDVYFKTYNANELVDTIVFCCYDNEQLLGDVRLRQLVSEIQPNHSESLQNLVDHFNNISNQYFEQHGQYAEPLNANEDIVSSVLGTEERPNSDSTLNSTTVSSGSTLLNPRRQVTAIPADALDFVRGEQANTYEHIAGVQLRRLRHHRFLSHVIQLCYNRAVSEPSDLNKQKPFSTETYGETMFLFVEHMIKQLFFEREAAADDDTPITSPDQDGTDVRVHEFPGWRPKRLSHDDRFVDLGSGVGQVVLQVAASVVYERPVIGIEKASVPQRYAKTMAQEFVRWMRFFARGYSPFVLIGDDFLDSAYADLVKRSTVIFANNFLFGPHVDLQLTQLFAELPEGAKVVSSKSFCEELTNITKRNENDISAIMKVETFDALVGAVSWTSTAFSFYLQTIDRTRLYNYYVKRHAGINDDREKLQNIVSSSKESLGSAVTSKPKARSKCVTKLIAEEESLGGASDVSMSIDGEGGSGSKDRVKSKKKLDEAGTASVLQLFHTQADSLTTKQILQRTGSGSMANGNGADAQFDPASVYPSSSFNLPEFNDFARERNDALRVPKLAAKPNGGSSRYSAVSSATSSNTKRVRNGQSSTTSTSISRCESTSGVSSDSTGAVHQANVPLSASVSGNEMQDAMKRVALSKTSAESLLSLLRAKVDQQRALVAEVEKKKDLVSRFVASQRARMHALLADFTRIELIEARKRCGEKFEPDFELSSGALANSESTSRILTLYVRKVRAAQDALRRRRELRSHILAARRKLDANVQELRKAPPPQLPLPIPLPVPLPIQLPMSLPNGLPNQVPYEHQHQQLQQSPVAAKINLNLSPQRVSANNSVAPFVIGRPMDAMQNPHPNQLHQSPVHYTVAANPFNPFNAATAQPQYFVQLASGPNLPSFAAAGSPMQLNVNCIGLQHSVNSASARPAAALFSPPGIMRPASTNILNLLSPPHTQVQSPAPLTPTQTLGNNLTVSVCGPLYNKPPNSM